MIKIKMTILIVINKIGLKKILLNRAEMLHRMLKSIQLSNLHNKFKQITWCKIIISLKYTTI